MSLNHIWNFNGSSMLYDVQENILNKWRLLVPLIKEESKDNILTKTFAFLVYNKDKNVLKYKITFIFNDVSLYYRAKTTFTCAKTILAYQILRLALRSL